MQKNKRGGLKIQLEEAKISRGREVRMLIVGNLWGEDELIKKSPSGEIEVKWNRKTEISQLYLKAATNNLKIMERKNEKKF